jgi:GT2 family glycosyltransferase
VVDDSPDASAERFVKRFDAGVVRYVKNPVPSSGRPATVRNIGWPRTTAEYVHFLDDDDRLHRGALRSLRAALEQRPSVGMAFGRIEPFGRDITELQRQQRYFADAARRAKIAHWRAISVARLLFGTTFFVNSACLIRRDCITKLGGYDPTIPVCEDVDFYLRAIRKFGGVFVDCTVLEYRTGASSLMHNLDGNRSLLESYGIIYSKYKREYGLAEFAALRLLGFAAR